MDCCTLFNQRITDFCKALGNEKRQEIILGVFNDNGEHNITEVAERVKIAQSTASEHLSLLKRAGVLVSKKVEKEVYYKLDRRSIIDIMDEIKLRLSCCLDD
ncbi:MAG: winged helix-turn-helix transcriptional regulator [Firmicutes bacterium]|nr:winged helix-turn-helix transcriptional regulator [Bacillota bacterium]